MIPVSLVRSSCDRGEALDRRIPIPATLDDRDPDGIVRLVVLVHRPVEDAVIVVSAVDIAQEIGRRGRSPVDVDLQLEGAHVGFDDDEDGVVGCGRGAREANGPEPQQGQKGDHRPSRYGVNGSAPRCLRSLGSPHFVPLPLLS